MTREEKKQVIKIFKNLKARYGQFDGILFNFDYSIHRTIEEFPIEKIKELGMLTEENAFGLENTYIIKMYTTSHTPLLYISNSPIEFTKTKVYKTIAAKDTRDAIYYYDVEIGEKEIHPLPLGLVMIVREGQIFYYIPADKDCHLDKRPLVK